MAKTLINVLYHRNPIDSKDKGKLILIERENGLKTKTEIEDPDFSFYVSKKDKFKEHQRLKNLFQPLNEVDEIKCKYLKLYGEMNNLIKTYDYDPSRINKYHQTFKSAYNSRNMYAFKKMHSHPLFYSTDIDFIDYNIRNWYETNGDKFDTTGKLTKAFFDIEVDSVDIVGFPDEDEANCPINAITYFYNGTLHAGFLRNSCRPNPLIAEAENDIVTFKQEFIEEFTNETNLDLKKHNTLLDVNIQFFNTEVELVKWFFHIVNEIDRPDIMMAWNIRFDFVTISNRLTKLGYEPASIICPLEFQSYRNSYYYTDMRAKDISEKKDYIEVNGYTQYSDQMINFAKLRVGTKYESYSLDAIAQATIGASKVDLQGYSIKDVAYKDYKLFMKYAMVDTFRLSQIEDKEEDVDMLYALSIITMTRINKVLTKTTSLRNLAAKFFFDQGFIIGNNPNINRLEMNKKVSAKFRGALTLQVLFKVS